MARLALLILALVAARPGIAQQDEQFRKAGVCGRCHVISVVEWGISRHSTAGTDCVACHGASKGHIVDERNNIKPERVPHTAAIASLCADCHKEGCPKSKHKAGCETCHNVHALVDPNKPPAVRDEGLEKRTAQWERFTRQMQAGEQAMQARQWEKARTAYQAALQESPGDRLASARLRGCERWLSGSLAGFEVVGSRFDQATGLPNEVRVSGLGIAMLLVPGGSQDIGSDHLPGAGPVHTVTIQPFYLGKFELTQAEWLSLMGTNPSVRKGDRLPVDSVSWKDAQELVRKLNERVPGRAFRLPTEAEWEFAARAGTAPGCPVAETAWFDESDKTAAPHPVGTKKPNKLGLYDLQGNLWEWTSSLLRPYPFDATDGREDLQSKGLRILRGGSYVDSADLLDPAMRHGERPDRSLHWNGIRLARSVPAAR